MNVLKRTLIISNVDNVAYRVKLIVCILLNLFIYLLAFLTQSPVSQYNTEPAEYSIQTARWKSWQAEGQN